jgi:low affinity Fe/Cu permease
MSTHTHLDSRGAGMTDLDRGAAKPMRFSNFARRLANLAGRPATFFAATAAVLLWAVTGPLFGFSDTWQLVINTSTTILTFLMVFIIQNTQNRDTAAIQIKLDELIRATEGAHNAILDLEQLDETQIEAYLKRYESLAAAARARLRAGRLDTGSPDLKHPEAEKARAKGG